jgi:hypothetical protein
MSIIISEECSFDSCDGGFEGVPEVVRESRFAKLEPCQRLVALPACDTAFPSTKSSNEAMNCISFMAATLLDSLPYSKGVVREVMVNKLLCILTGPTSITVAVGLLLCSWSRSSPSDYLLLCVAVALCIFSSFVSLLHFVFLVYCSLVAVFCRIVILILFPKTTASS